MTCGRTTPGGKNQRTYSKRLNDICQLDGHRPITSGGSPLGYQPEEEEEEDAGEDDLPDEVEPGAGEQNEDGCGAKNQKCKNQPCSFF